MFEGVTVIELVTAPFDQAKFPAHPFATKVVELPAQIVALLPVPNEIVGAAGVGLTVTVTFAEAGLVQLLTLQVTV